MIRLKESPEYKCDATHNNEFVFCGRNFSCENKIFCIILNECFSYMQNCGDEEAHFQNSTQLDSRIIRRQWPGQRNKSRDINGVVITTRFVIMNYWWRQAICYSWYINFKILQLLKS